MISMDQQDRLEAQYKDSDGVKIPESDPFPRMIIVCIVITLFFLAIILGTIFFDLVVRRPEQNVRPSPIQAQPTQDAARR
jgi:hypothetical protein